MVMLCDCEFSRREKFKQSKGKILNRHGISQYFPPCSTKINILPFFINYIYVCYIYILLHIFWTGEQSC